jgi:hypothetical protein
MDQRTLGLRRSGSRKRRPGRPETNGFRPPRLWARSGSTPVFAPARDRLRELLHETGGYAWLLDQTVLPPAWADPEEV